MSAFWAALGGLALLIALLIGLVHWARAGDSESEHSNMDIDGPDDDAAATVAMEREDKQP